MGQNSQEVAYGFGQLGSVFNDGTGVMTPPVGKCFIAITMITDVKFSADPSGLIAQTKQHIDGTVSGDEYGAVIATTQGLEYIGTSVAAHNLSADSETAISGAGGLIVDDSNVFPKGITIYGRWISIKPASGTIIAYLGE